MFSVDLQQKKTMFRNRRGGISSSNRWYSHTQTQPHTHTHQNDMCVKTRTQTVHTQSENSSDAGDKAIIGIPARLQRVFLSTHTLQHVLL